MAALASCNGFLDEDPKGSVTPENFYKNKEDLHSAIRGIALMHNLAWNQTGGMAITFGSDEITTHAGGNKTGFVDFDVFRATSSNDRMPVWWDNLYKTIKSANSLIANYSGATSATEADRSNAGGVGYFYRALCYFFLTRAWGEIPMPLEPGLTPQSNARPGEIYEVIVADLQKAESMLPDSWSSPMQQSGVDIIPTKGAAKALLANVYLTMAGWPLRQTDKYALAAAKAKEVIDNKATWGYGLMTNFAALWDKDFRFNKEAVFACYYSKDMGDGNQLGPPNFAAGEEGGWDEAFGEITFYDKFPAGPRKEATYQSVYYLNNDPAKQVDYTKLTHKHPYFLKYRDDKSYDPATHKMNDWWGSATVYIIRYAEVLLTYAEASAMAGGGPDASAYSAVNEVRKRAGLDDLQPGLSQAAFRDSVIAERGWEFAGCEPAARWFDLVRTETVAKANASRSPVEMSLKGKPNDETHAFYWAPLPITR